MCRLAGIDADVERVLSAGGGRETFERMLTAQGGRLEAGLPEAAVRLEVKAEAGGWVEGIDALEVGLTNLALGAGRLRKEDRIDPGAGISIERGVGEEVRAGDVLAVIHAASSALAEAAAPRLRAAWRLAAAPVERPPHVLERVAT